MSIDPTKPANTCSVIKAEDTPEFRRAFSNPICLTCGTPQYGRVGDSLVRKGLARPPLLPKPVDYEDE